MNTSVYNTRQKKLIYEFFESNRHKQFTCDEITYLLLNKGTPVGKTTVYRQLENLINEGKIKKLTPHKGKSFLYQYIDENLDCENHMHLRCVRCGKYIHLSCEFMTQVSDHIIEHHDFVVDNAKTEILGLCKDCTD